MQHPPHLVNIYYAEKPEFDFEEMKEYLLEMDPQGPEDVEITTVDENRFVIKMDKINIQVMKSPERDEGIAKFIQQAEQFPEEFRDELANHKEIYQAVVTNVPEIGPFESQISLLKAATALCDCDGICAALPFSGIILPAKVLDEANDTVFGGAPEDCDCGEDHDHEHCDHCHDDEEGEDEDHEEYTLWDMLRMEGQPQMFLMSIAGFKNENDGADSMWMVTRGLTFCGLPDIVIRVEKQEEANMCAQLLQSAFSFQIVNRKSFTLGEKVDLDEDSYIEFSEPPQIQCPFPTFGCLLAKVMPKKPKSKIEIVRS